MRAPDAAPAGAAVIMRAMDLVLSFPPLLLASRYQHRPERRRPPRRQANDPRVAADTVPHTSLNGRSTSPWQYRATRVMLISPAIRFEVEGKTYTFTFLWNAKAVAVAIEGALAG